MNAIFGVKRVSLRVTVVFLSPKGKSILTSPRPITLILEPSAVCTSYGVIEAKLMNLDRSGQKWDVAPESTIALQHSAGIFICFAMLIISDDAKA